MMHRRSFGATRLDVAIQLTQTMVFPGELDKCSRVHTAFDTASAAEGDTVYLTARISITTVHTTCPNTNDLRASDDPKGVTIHQEKRKRRSNNRYLG